MRFSVFALLSVLLLQPPIARAGNPKLLRVGIIGCDTSHVPAFTKILNNPDAKGDLAGFKVVAAFAGGSKDIPTSIDRVPKFVKTLRDDYGVEMVDSIDELLKKVDVVLLESVDGRPHLEQARPVIKAGKPLFIDKPVAGSLADAIEIFELAAQHKVPCFSSSSFRFVPGVIALKDSPKIGAVIGCDVHGPCSLEEHHPDLFWYGVHGVETLYTLMGTGCDSVVRTHTKGTDVVTGTWKDGRIGTFRGLRQGSSGYGITVFGDKGIVREVPKSDYTPLVMEIAKCFRTGKAPISAAETIELFAFMEAADESKRQGGKPVTIHYVMEKAKAEIAKRRAAGSAEQDAWAGEWRYMTNVYLPVGNNVFGSKGPAPLTCQIAKTKEGYRSSGMVQCGGQTFTEVKPGVLESKDRKWRFVRGKLELPEDGGTIEIMRMTLGEDPLRLDPVRFPFAAQEALLVRRDVSK
jgi:predicted dehydrogenase